MGFELILYFRRKPPERNEVGSVEDVFTPILRDAHHDAHLREKVSRRKSPAKQNGPIPPEQPSGIPPARNIHFSVARDRQTKFEKIVEIHISGLSVSWF